MFKKLLTLLTGLTAVVFFTQSSIAAESDSVEKPSTMQVLNKEKKNQKKDEFKNKQNKINAKKQQQNAKKKNAKKKKK